MNRREFLEVLGAASVTAQLSGCASLKTARPQDYYALPAWGDARVLHITDTHAQLNPIYFREPDINLGVGAARGQLPHLVGRNLLDRLPSQDPRDVHAFTCIDFTEAAERYGRVGGFAHLKTLIDTLRAESGALLLDGGDTWQGSGTSLWTRGRDMVEACNILGVDVMTGHWEFTYQAQEVLDNAALLSADFVSQNIRATEDSLFEGTHVFDEDTGHVFPPYAVKEINGRRVAVIGQSFPYTPIANPQRFIPDWSFGIRESDLAGLVQQVRSGEQVDAVVLLSHNGMDVDLKLASRVPGIDFIMGGHTHDGVPVPVVVANPGGKTVVTNAGSNGKFVGVLDIKFGAGDIEGYRYRLLPVFANLLKPDAGMQAHIDGVRAPYLDKLREPLAVTDSLLYRRGNFNGTFDQVICDALREVLDAQISLSPGFRWGTSVLPGETITTENVMDQTGMTYPETYVREMRGEEIRVILESVADNLFNPDPYYQQGGDMVRVGGLRFSCAPDAPNGERIRNLELPNGSPLQAGTAYKVAGWATVGQRSPGPPVWNVVADYLRNLGTIRIKEANQPTLVGVKDDPGIARYDCV
ncbi:MAG: thiosulfohydrolase SoxB [Pseudomonadales bacterium]|nr:thiosulfohydrolase SoxB [Pseudomonadales bacterium]NIX08089.1 thiosulfohydrolase SoxB [Pseudomonadales bacterium]